MYFLRFSSFETKTFKKRRFFFIYFFLNIIEAPRRKLVAKRNLKTNKQTNNIMK